MRRSWSKDAVVSELKLRQAQGLSLERSALEAEDRSLLWAADEYFGKGGFFKALRKIGIHAKPKHQSWSPEKVIATIRRLYKKHGRINSNFVQKNYAPLYQRALFYFGSWQKAVEAAGMDYALVRKVAPHKKWSKTAVLREIRKRKRLGMLNRGSIGSEDDRNLYHAANRYFGEGGWHVALQKTGLKPLAQPTYVDWTKELVIAEIHTLQATRERLPSAFIEKNGYWGLIKAARKLFGSWKNAIVAAGLDFEKVRPVRQLKWTKEKVIAEIQRLDQIGVRLNHKNIRETRCELLTSAINRFGSWSQALHAAGFNYREHALIWSTKAWLRQLSDTQVSQLTERATVLSSRRKKRS